VLSNELAEEVAKSRADCQYVEKRAMPLLPFSANLEPMTATFSVTLSKTALSLIFSEKPLLSSVVFSTATLAAEVE